MVSESDICAMITDRIGDIESLPAQLVDCANENGGNDNITVLLGKKESGIDQDT